MRPSYHTFLLLCYIITLISSVVYCQGHFDWVAGAEGVGRSITLVSDGVIVTGKVQDTTFADKTVSIAGNADIILAKFDKSGKVIWVKTAGGTSDDVGLAITTTSDGSIIIGGTYDTQATFDTHVEKGKTGSNLFIAKYDSSGNFVWIKTIGFGQYKVSICVTSDDSIVVTTFYDSTTHVNATVVTYGSLDIFVAKYDNNGEMKWSAYGGGTGSDFPGKVSPSSDGGVYLIGSFKSSATFGTKTVTSKGGTDLFILKYSSTGDVEWIRTEGDTNDISGELVIESSDGGLIVTGNFNGKMIVGNTTLTSYGDSDIFVIKYNSTGHVEWAVSGGGTEYEYTVGVSEGSDGSIYVAGEIASPLGTFGSYIKKTIGNEDMFIAKYTKSGTIEWVEITGGTDYDAPNSMVMDGDDIYITGYYGPSAQFGDTILDCDSSGIFIAKYSPYYCYNIHQDSSSVCSGKGECIKHDKCCCSRGFAGHKCQRTKEDDPYYYSYCV
jgi:hypothetical protein